MEMIGGFYNHSDDEQKAAEAPKQGGNKEEPPSGSPDELGGGQEDPGTIRANQYIYADFSQPVLATGPFCTQNGESVWSTKWSEGT